MRYDPERRVVCFTAKGEEIVVPVADLANEESARAWLFGQVERTLGDAVVSDAVFAAWFADPWPAVALLRLQRMRGYVTGIRNAIKIAEIGGDLGMHADNGERLLSPGLRKSPPTPPGLPDV